MSMTGLRKATVGMTVFSHVDPNGKDRHFDIDYLTGVVSAGIADGTIEVVQVAVDAEGAAVIEQERGMDMHRLKRLIFDTVKRGIVSPVIFAAGVNPGTHLLVDGTHRYYVAVLREMDTVPAVLLEPDVWERSLVDVSDFFHPDVVMDSETILSTPSNIA